MLESKKNSLYLNNKFDVVRISGSDSIDLLHRISTNEVRKIEDNCFISTIFLNDKGKIVEIFQFFNLEDSFLGISSSYETINQWIDKYVFTEDIKIEKADFVLCDVILGEGITKILDSNLTPGIVNTIQYENQSIYAFVEYSNHVKILVPNSLIDSITNLDEFDKISDDVFSQWRINSMVGTQPTEYNESFIPLEVGLVDHISFTKGCYIGQEIIARLDTYQKVSKYLVQIKSDKELDPNQNYKVKNISGKLLGKLTSIGTLEQDGFYHLGVVHKSLCEENTPIIIESEDNDEKISGYVDDALTNKTYYSP